MHETFAPKMDSAVNWKVYALFEASKDDGILAIALLTVIFF